MSALSTAAIVGIAGATASVGAAAIGASSARKNRKSAERQAGRANDARNREAQQVRDFEFKNVYEGIGEGATYDPTTISASQVGATGINASTAQAGTLGAASGYQGQGYSAGQVGLRNLASGADFLSNPFANLQVGTAAADLQASETDRSLAAALQSGAITGGGGATALAQAAAGSKASIGANIQQQELQNAQLRAQGQQTLEQGLLSQSNAANQFGFQQDSFNVGQANQAAAFTASAQNQANQFNAGNRNQFALSQFGADNQFAQFNAQSQQAADQFSASAQNQASQANAQLSQQANTFNAAAYTQADQFAANQANERELLSLQAQDNLQERQYNQRVNLLNSAGGQAAQASQNAVAARNASAQTTGAALGAVGGAVNSLSNIDFSSKSAVDTSQFGFGKSGGPGGNFNLLQGR